MAIKAIGIAVSRYIRGARNWKFDFVWEPFFSISVIGQFGNFIIKG